MTPETPQTETDPFPLHTCLAGFNQEQLDLYTAIRDLHRSQSYNEAQKKYRIGRLLHQGLRNKRRYGQYTVFNIAIALGLALSSLYRWASVAASYPPDVFKDLMRKCTPQGNRLSWSHLVLLARIPDQHQRQRLIDLVLEENLSTDGLYEEMKPILAALKTPAQARQSRNPAVGLRLVEKRVKRMLGFCQVFDLGVTEKLLREDQTRVRPEVVKRLRSVEELFSDLIGAAKGNREAVRNSLAKFDKRQSDSFSRPLADRFRSPGPTLHRPILEPTW